MRDLALSGSAILLLLISPMASMAAEVVVGHPATAVSGESVAITVFGDPMGAVDIAYRIELFVSEGVLSVVSTTTPSPFDPTPVTGTCGIVSVDGCIAADGNTSPFAQTFAATQLATLALDTTGLAPGTEVFVRVASPGYDFFGAPRPGTQIITIVGAPPVPAIPAPIALSLLGLLVAATGWLRLTRASEPG